MHFLLLLRLLLLLLLLLISLYACCVPVHVCECLLRCSVCVRVFACMISTPAALCCLFTQTSFTLFHMHKLPTHAATHTHTHTYTCIAIQMKCVRQMSVIKCTDLLSLSRSRPTHAATLTELLQSLLKFCGIKKKSKFLKICECFEVCKRERESVFACLCTLSLFWHFTC